MEKQKLYEYIKLSSIPLRELDSNGMPIRSACSCLIDYKGKRFLLTVQHATGTMGNWVAELKYEPRKGTQTYQLGPMNFLMGISSNPDLSFDLRDVDFSYVEVPDNLMSFLQEITKTGKIISEIPRIICKTTFNNPDTSEKYGFSGYIMSTTSGIALISRHVVYQNLKYIGSKEDYYIFELPMSHPGDEHFEGCSGAPIIDTQANTVALVCGSPPNTNYIYGISLRQYKIAIDIETMKK